MSPRRVRLQGNLYDAIVPEGAVSIVRPGRWGNPHPIGRSCSLCHVKHTRPQAVAKYLEDIDTGRSKVSVEEIRRGRELAGKDLACWCMEGELCHGDVLLAICDEEREVRP